MKSKPKILIFFILCTLTILGLWFYSLKLNLRRSSDNKGKFDLNLEEIFNDLSKIFKKLPPAPNFTTSTDASNQIINSVIDKLKKLENISTANWQTYTNEEFKFQLKHPPTWQLEFRKGSNFNSNGSFMPTKTLWRLNLDIDYLNENTCKENFCYDFFLLGYPRLEYNSVLQKLQNDPSLIKIIKETKTAEMPTIIYKEKSGICNDKSALIFTENQTLQLFSHCGEDNQEISNLFNQILSTFKFLK